VLNARTVFGCNIFKNANRGENLMATAKSTSTKEQTAKAKKAETAKAAKAKKVEAAKVAKAKKAETAKVAKAKKAEDAKAAAAAKALVPVSLTTSQEKSMEMVTRNQVKIAGAAEGMIKLAFDSGQRLLALKEEITKKFGRKWKEWSKTEGNLPIGYEQATRYMKLAANPAQFALVDATSIEGAVKQIEHQLKPAKKVAADKAKAEKRTQKLATAGVISNATLEEVAQCNDIEELRGLITLCEARIEELREAPSGDTLDQQEAAADVDAAAQEAAAELVE